MIEYRNIGVPGASGSGSNQDAQQAAAALAQMARASGPSLAEVLKPEVMLPLLQVDRKLDLQDCCNVRCLGGLWDLLAMTLGSGSGLPFLCSWPCSLSAFDADLLCPALLFSPLLCSSTEILRNSRRL